LGLGRERHQFDFSEFRPPSKVVGQQSLFWRPAQRRLNVGKTWPRASRSAASRSRN